MTADQGGVQPPSTQQVLEGIASLLATKDRDSDLGSKVAVGNPIEMEVLYCKRQKSLIND